MKPGWDPQSSRICRCVCGAEQERCPPPTLTPFPAGCLSLLSCSFPRHLQCPPFCWALPGNHNFSSLHRVSPCQQLWNSFPQLNPLQKSFAAHLGQIQTRQVSPGVQLQHRPLWHWHQLLPCESFLVWKSFLWRKSSQLCWGLEKHIWLGPSFAVSSPLGQSCKGLLTGMERASSPTKAFCFQLSPSCTQGHPQQVQAPAALQLSWEHLPHLPIFVLQLPEPLMEFSGCFS